MALVKYGGGITQMSGSIAGNTYARNRYGNYARARTKPVNPNTARQTIVRSALAALTERWSDTLTNVQRIAWNLYAANVAMKNKLGETIHLSGFNHYIRSNMLLTQMNLTEVDDGPVVFEIPASDPTFSIIVSEAAQTISCTFDNGMDWADENGAWMFFFQGQPQNPQRNFFAGPWRLLAAQAGVNGAPPVPPFAPGAVFAVSELQRVWAYARIIRADGRLSAPFTDDTFVVA